ncbi:MAG: YkvA family protein [Bacteroidota bacterium]
MMNKKDKKQKLEEVESYKPHFSERSFWGKLKWFGRQAGVKTVYVVLLLYYSFRRKETPAWAKNIILGMIGYFIAPFDALPDLTPIIGYTDDIGVLMFGLVTISAYVNEEVKGQARQRLQQWFGEYDDAVLVEVDEKL